MTGNFHPWLILIGIVVVVLYLKGYIKLPAVPKAASPANLIGVAGDIARTGVDLVTGRSAAAVVDAKTTLVDVGKLTAHEIAVLLAHRAQSEAAAENTAAIAAGAVASVKEAVQAPTVPAAASPAPSSVGT